MRARLASRVVVAGVAAIALAAVVSAVVARGERDERPRARVDALAGARVDPLAAELEALGVRGTLVYRDPRCGLRALRLPTLEPVRPPPPHRDFKTPGAGRSDVEGCAAFVPPSGAPPLPHLAPRELAAALRRHGTARWLAHGGRGRYSLEEVVPLREGRWAAVVRGAVGWERFLAFFDWDRVVAAQFDFGDRGDDLRASPAGSYVAVLKAARSGEEVEDVEVFDVRGKRVELPRTLLFRGSIAWSPDEEWTALATRASVYLFRTRDPHDHLIRLPVATRDIAWR